MALEILLLLAGFVILVKGADFLVGGSSSLAKKFNVSNLAIGLTVVAFGTSTPELVVSVLSAVNERSDASFGNVLGSNNFNILLILGVAGLIYPLVVHRDTILYEVPFSFLALVTLFLLVNDSILWESDSDFLSRIDAGILLILFMAFMAYIFRTMNTEALTEQPQIKIYSMQLSIFFAVLGIAMLIGGGSLVIDNAVAIASRYSISERLIGLTILAVGTSLPELATSAVAAYRKNTDIAIGNVIGSNIFNITLILGVTGLIHPIHYNAALNLDMQVLGAATIVLLIFMFTINQRKLDRWEAFILLTGYLTYTIYQIFNDQVQG